MNDHQPDHLTGVLCGTSLLDAEQFSDLPEETIYTERKPVDVRRGDGFLLLQRHRSPDGYVPPHEVDHKAHILALKHAGVERIFSIQSTGSLTNRIPPGTFAIPHDFLNPWQIHTFFSDERGHRAISFSDTLRKQIREALKEENFTFTEEAVYVQTLGPRFETPAEGQLLSDFGDVVGMTAAAEVILANEQNLPYATLCSVDNYVNGIQDTEISMDKFQKQVQQNRSSVLRAVKAVLSFLT